jgi:hypothetical protein
VNEALPADIDAHMGIASTLFVEKQQVSGPQLLHRNPVGGAILRPGTAGNIQAGQMIAVLHKATAVKSLSRGVSSIVIAGSHELLRIARSANTVGIAAMARGRGVWTGRGAGRDGQQSGEQEEGESGPNHTYLPSPSTCRPLMTTLRSHMRSKRFEKAPARVVSSRSTTHCAFSESA